MAIHTWLDGSGDFDLAANWDSGVKPSLWGAGDEGRILSGVQDIQTNIDQSAKPIATLRIGDFRGKLGTPASPLKFGATTSWYFDAPRCQQFCYFPASLATGIILETGSAPYACHLYDGAITDLYVRAAQSLILGALLNPTSVYFLGKGGTQDIVALIEAGCAAATYYIWSGLISSKAIATTINLLAGTWDHQGDAGTAANVTTLNQYGGLFKFNAPGATITTVNGYGGTFDASADGRAKTITTATTWATHLLNLDNRTGLIGSTNIYIKGGKYIGYTAPTAIVVPPPMGA